MIKQNPLPLTRLMPQDLLILLSDRLVVAAAICSASAYKRVFTIEDPRVERTRLHLLSDILTIAILSVMAGGEGWEDMELYGVSKHAWLSTFLVLANGIPSEDTFRRVFERIDPKQFEDCFEGWVKQLVNELGFK